MGRLGKCKPLSTHLISYVKSWAILWFQGQQRVFLWYFKSSKLTKLSKIFNFYLLLSTLISKAITSIRIQLWILYSRQKMESMFFGGLNTNFLVATGRLVRPLPQVLLSLATFKLKNKQLLRLMLLTIWRKTFRVVLEISVKILKRQQTLQHP